MDSKKSAIKNLILKSILLIFSILLAAFISEIICRFTKHKYFLLKPMTFPQYYFRSDVEAGYDLSNNFPARTFVFQDSNYLIWTNELGCFDNPYNGEKDYILLVGDSATWGFTRFDCKFGTLIEELLGSRVLKCGVPGYGTRQELIKIKKITGKTKYSPKLIILGYFLENDFQDDWLSPGNTVINGRLIKKVSFDSSTGKRYFISENELVKMERNWQKYGNVNGPVSFLKKIQNWLRSHSALYHVIASNQLVKIMTVRFGLASKKETATNNGLMEYLYYSDNYQKLKDEWLEHFNNLKEIKKITDKYDIKLLVILIPNKYQVYDFLSPSLYARKYIFNNIANMLQDCFEGEGIFFFNLTPLFRKYADLTPRKHIDSRQDLYWEYDWHWNIKGNKLAALLIADFIIDNNLIEIKNAEIKQGIKQKIKKGLNELKK